MKLPLALTVALAATLGTAAAQGTPASANTTAPARSSISGGKPAAKAAKGNKLVTRSGGQGHDSGSDPKGKILVAPTTSPKGKPAGH